MGMTPYFDVPTPASREASLLASVYGLEHHGLTLPHRVYWNLPEPALYEEAIFRRYGRLSYMVPLLVIPGKHTARAALD
jgi:phosphoenolpyruvate carboxykinase (ATP)